MAGLRSRVVLITGASSALGRATALSFAKQGAKLALVEHQKIHMEEFYTPLHKNEGNSCNLHTTYKLKRISAECKNLGASDVYFCQYDVTSRDGAREVFEKVTERFSHSLSVLVNNNAVLSPENGASANIEDDQKFADIIGLNVMAAVRFTQLSVPYLAKASASSTTGGSVVNINGPSITVNPGAAMAHKLAQGSMDELTTSLAIDLASKGIRVNGVRAGGQLALIGNATNMALRSLDSALLDPEDGTTAGGAHASKGFPGLAGRIGTSQDVAEVVQFLASDEAKFITGQTLAVDGGASLCDAPSAAANTTSGRRTTSGHTIS